MTKSKINFPDISLLSYLNDTIECGNSLLLTIEDVCGSLMILITKYSSIFVKDNHSSSKISV